MDIKEIKEKKSKLETDIRLLLEKFTDTTGLAVGCIYNYPIESLGFDYPTSYYIECEIKL